MKNLLYVLAVMLILGWIAGLMLKIAGALIHLLLVIAVIAIFINAIRPKKSV